MLRILHLSDSHFGISDKTGEQDRIVEALISAAHSSKTSPEICIFSGDLAQSGAPEQFQKGELWLSRLLEPWPKAKLLIVPGNHDVYRGLAKPNLLRTVSEEQDSFQEWVEQPNLPHLQKFFEWHETAKSTGKLPLISSWADPLGFVAQHQCNDGIVALIGLNSSILSCSDTDKGNLCVDLRSLNNNLSAAKKMNGLTVAVVHHPLQDLTEWNRVKATEILSQETGAHLLLHGHLHEQAGQFQGKSTGSSLGIFSAGAAYQGSQWPQTFAFYDIDFEQRELIPTTYNYSRNAGEWVIESELSRPIIVNIPMLSNSKPSARKALSGTGAKQKKRTFQSNTSSAAANSPDVDQERDSATELEIYKYCDAATSVREQLMKYLEDATDIKSLCYTQLSRIKNKKRISEKIKTGGLTGPCDLVDICGFRLVTYFPSEIVVVLRAIFEIVSGDRVSGAKFILSKPVEVRIHTSRPENDPLSISNSIRQLTASLMPTAIIEERSHRTGYSSIHVVAWIAPDTGDHGVREMRIEFQLRSALEELWGAIDHKLRYGSERGRTGVTWQRHLNIMKTLVDGLMQYVDEVKRQSEEEHVSAPPEIKNVRSINPPSREIERLRGLPEEIHSRLVEAYVLWKRADATTSTGGDPGIFRKGADAFAAIGKEFNGEPAGDPELAKNLQVLIKAEQAYLLMYTGDDVDLKTSATLYEEIEKLNPNYSAAHFRLGLVKRRLEDFAGSRLSLRRALSIIEGNLDPRITIESPLYLDAQLALALTEWRISEDKTLPIETRRDALSTAVKVTTSVFKGAGQAATRINALNDLLYYVWELDDLGLKVKTDGEMRHLCDELRDHLHVHNTPHRYEFFDTLQRCYRRLGDIAEAQKWALEVRNALKDAALLSQKGLVLPRDESSFAWTFNVIRYLTGDQKDALSVAQDLLNTPSS